MIVGLGLDLCDVARIERAIEKPHFLKRLYTPTEREAIARKGAQTAAGYFAAKEAVAKALGTGFRGFQFADLEIRTDELGRPEVALSGGALERMAAIGGDRALITITHLKEYAAAVCVIESDGE